jgi:Pro-kumamolisin, activation domain
MLLKPSFLRSLFLVAFSSASILPRLFADPSTVAFPTSVKTVPAWTQPGSPNPNGPFIIGSTLTAAELGSPIDFEVALKMRNFANLQARIAKGEVVSPQELNAKYNPLPSDQKAVAQWLVTEGFTITRQGPLSIFAQGTVGQVEKAMQVRFAHVSFDGQLSVSAVSTPYLPASFASAVLGINGLQPYIRMHKN